MLNSKILEQLPHKEWFSTDYFLLMFEKLKQLAEKPNCMVLAVMAALKETTDIENSLLLLKRGAQIAESKLNPQQEAVHLKELFTVVGKNIEVEIIVIAPTDGIAKIIEIMNSEILLGNHIFLGWSRSTDNPTPHISHINCRWERGASAFEKGFDSDTPNLNQAITDNDIWERIFSNDGIILFICREK